VERYEERQAELDNPQRLPQTLYALLFAVTVMTAVGNLGLVSVMPAIGRALAIPDALIACTFSLSALAWAFSSPVWARRSDRQGRKPMLLLGLAGFTVSMGGCALVVLAGLHALAAPLVIFALFALVRSSYGLFGSAAATAAQALVADRSQGMVRVRALSGIAGALSLGTIMGPAIAPFFIFWPAGIAGPPLVFALAGLVLVAAVGALLPRDRPIVEASGKAGPSLWRDPALRPLLIQGIVIASAQAINIYTLGFAVIDSAHSGIAGAQWWIGLTMSLGAASGLAAQIGLVNLIKPSPLLMLRGGAAIVLAGNLIAIAPGGLSSLVAGFVIASFGYGLARPGFSSAASIAVGPERQGAVAGAVSSIAGASIAGPPIVAVALYQYWWSAPFVLAAIGAAWVALSTGLRGRLFPQGD
jgi:MFS family permease